MLPRKINEECISRRPNRGKAQVQKMGHIGKAYKPLHKHGKIC